MSYPLFEHQPYTLALATKMATARFWMVSRTTFTESSTIVSVRR